MTRKALRLLPSLAACLLAVPSAATGPQERAADESSAGPAACPQLKPRLRAVPRFVAGLAGAWIPREAPDCLYVIPPRMARPVAIFRFGRGRRLRGPVWSPTQAEISVAYRRSRGFEVALLDTSGETLRRFVGRDAAFFRDGRAVLRRRDELWVVDGGRTRRLARHEELEGAAGFALLGADLGGTDGYGRAGVVVNVWGEDVARLLLVRPDGSVSRITPAYRARRGRSMPGPPAWSPDGRILLLPWQRAHPRIPASHEHCLARWSSRRGYRATLCRNPHFDRILWHPDGGTALLNNGLVVARDGTVRARIRLAGRDFSVRWKRPLPD